MQTPSTLQIVVMAATLISSAAALAKRAKMPLPAQAGSADAYQDAKHKRSNYATLGFLCLAIFASIFLSLLRESQVGAVQAAARVNILGLSVASSVVTVWIVIGVVILLAVLARILVIPHFKEAPKGVQTVLEASVSATDKVAGAGKRMPGHFKKHKRFYSITLAILAAEVILGLLLSMAPSQPRELTVELSPPRVDLFGFSVSSTVLVAWIIIAVLLIGAAIIRFALIPRFKETPRGLQNVLELMVSEMSKFTRERLGHENEGLSVYFFAIAALFLGSAVVELFGFRPPTTDLTMAFSYAMITFILINYYGIRKKGLGGRLKTFLQPMPAMAPFKLLSDIAVPVSLAGRLAGNMLGGMIVVDLLYYALGTFSVGIPAVLGLFFDAFHPLIQFFIFINLSLTFIGEAME